MAKGFFKIIACEIAFREICHVTARSPNLIDLDFLTQGLHDTPCQGRLEIQSRIDAVPEGKYDAILIGYGLCGNIIKGLRARHTPLVLPRAHDCITFFLGSRRRYEQYNEKRTGTYYYTSGWLECLRRRGEESGRTAATFLPTRAGTSRDTRQLFAEWTEKFGEENARYLLETMDEWTHHYTHGVLINFDFTKLLRLEEQVKQICAQRGWQFEEVSGDLDLLQRWVDGAWSSEDFLVLPPGQSVAPSYDERIIESEPATNAATDIP